MLTIRRGPVQKKPAAPLILLRDDLKTILTG